MNLIKCSKGHFYDGDRFASCPHCGGAAPSSDSVTISLPSGGSSDVTVALSPGAPEESVTVSRSDYSEPVSTLSDLMDEAQNVPSGPSDEGVTVSYYSQKIAQPALKEPVVGWLVCTSGKYFGQSFCLKSGRNFVGRSTKMDVCLEGENSVSRDRHAVIIYEPMGRIFIAQPGDSRELFYVNDDVVLDNVVLKPYDVISLGKVNMMMIPCCTREFAWEDLAEPKAEEKK